MKGQKDEGDKQDGKPWRDKILTYIALLAICALPEYRDGVQDVLIANMQR